MSIDFYNAPGHLEEARNSSSQPLRFEEHLLSPHMPSLRCVAMTVVNSGIEAGEVGSMSREVIRWVFPVLYESEMFTLKSRACESGK